MKRPNKASTIFRDFIAESILGVSGTYMCTCVYVCAHNMCLCTYGYAAQKYC